MLPWDWLGPASSTSSARAGSAITFAAAESEMAPRLLHELAAYHIAPGATILPTPFLDGRLSRQTPLIQRCKLADCKKRRFFLFVSAFPLHYAEAISRRARFLGDDFLSARRRLRWPRAALYRREWFHFSDGRAARDDCARCRRSLITIRRACAPKYAAAIYRRFGLVID